MYQVKSNLYAIMLSIQKSVKYKYISQEMQLQVLIYRLFLQQIVFTLFNDVFIPIQWKFFIGVKWSTSEAHE